MNFLSALSVLVVASVMSACGPIPAFDHDLETVYSPRTDRPALVQLPDGAPTPESPLVTTPFGGAWRDWSAVWQTQRCQAQNQDWDSLNAELQSASPARLVELEGLYGLGRLEIRRGGVLTDPARAGVNMVARLFMSSMGHGTSVGFRIGATQALGIFDVFRVLFIMDGPWNVEIRLVTAPAAPSFLGRCADLANCVNLPVHYPGSCPR